MQSPTAARRRMTDLSRRTRLLEREAELEQIGGALHLAAAGSGAIVTIEGAAGIGKSSLLGAAAQLAKAEGMVVLRARCGVMEREFALGVVIQLLAPIIEPLTDRERERAFAGAAGLARPLFEEVPDRAAADDRLFARFHGLHWLCARLAEDRPLALLVDDAHWADEHSLPVPGLSRGADRGDPRLRDPRRADRRPPSAPGRLDRADGARAADGGPAARAQPGGVAELVRASLGDQAEDEVCDACARTTGGNPLLARQLVAAIEERGAGRAELDADAVAAVGPPSVAAFVTARPAVGARRPSQRSRGRWRYSATMPRWLTLRRLQESIARRRATR